MSQRNNRAALIEVSGVGQLPIDMLRYDCCSPHPDDVGAFNAAVQDTTNNATGRLLRYRVRLLCWSPAGPTPARWASFMWTCDVL